MYDKSVLNSVENKVLSVVFFKDDIKSCGSVFEYAKETQWEKDILEGDYLDNHFFTKNDFLNKKENNSKVLISGGCFGKDFETKKDFDLICDVGFDVIIAERFSLKFLEIAKNFNLILITLFRDNLTNKILSRLISRPEIEIGSEVDENFKIKIMLTNGYDFTKNLSIQIFTNEYVRFESFRIKSFFKTYLGV